MSSQTSNLLCMYTHPLYSSFIFLFVSECLSVHVGGVFVYDSALEADEQTLVSL